MKFDPKKVYFGCLTYNAKKDGFYYSSPETFIETEDGYLRLNSKSNDILKSFYEGTEEYLTVSNLFPMVNLMNENKISSAVSEHIISWYLLKYRLINSKKQQNISDYKKKKR